MGLLSSPLVKVLGGHGVICYYCFLFFVSSHPSELETALHLPEVHPGGPRRSPQASSPFCFVGHNVKNNKTIPLELFNLLLPARLVPALGVPGALQEPHLCEEGTPLTWDLLGVSALAQRQLNPQEGCDPKKQL